MKKMMFVTICLCIMAPFYGCAHNGSGFKVHAIPIECPPGTPEGTTCLWTAKTAFDFGGSQKLTVVATKVQGDGLCQVQNSRTGKIMTVRCGTKIVGVYPEADRLATLSAPILGAASQLGSAAIGGHYRVRAARADNGDEWNIISYSEGGIGFGGAGGQGGRGGSGFSSSGAISSQTTGVDVTSGTGCPDGNCK